MGDTRKTNSFMTQKLWELTAQTSCQKRAVVAAAMLVATGVVCILVFQLPQLKSVQAQGRRPATTLSTKQNNATQSAVATQADFSQATIPQEKSETVTVQAAPDGSFHDIRVAVQLTNPGSAKTLRDQSNLSELEEDETNARPTKTAQGLLWSSGEPTLKYKGKSTQQLPFALRISYELDGKTITAKQLAGKSGHVKICYQFENLTSKDSKHCVPFVALSALMLDGEKFSKVQVSNGKSMDMNERIMVVGYAMPGLQEGLHLKGDTQDIPSSFTIEADVKDFALDTAVTLVSTDALNDFKLEFGEDARDSMDKLKDASSQLTSGSQSLADGMDKLSSGAGTLSDAIVTAQTGASQLSEGVDSYTSGVDQAAKGTTTLQAALDAAVEEAQSQAAVAQDTLSQLQTQYAAAYEAVLADPNPENLAALHEAVQALAHTSGIAGQAAGAAAALQNDQLTQGISSLNTGLSRLSANSQQLKDGASQLNDGLLQLSDASGALAKGTDKAAEGSSALAEGFLQLDKQGIQRIVSLYEDDVVGLRDRIKSLQAAGKRYDTFSGIEAGTKGSVRFVIKTAAIGLD
ncbi:hypothetical protein [uncultured Olegusella sp.]|uniref:hypothetical protein n=1 Tax=uncultured Olegusella sp. TaxID=1979846 RepID=UPI0026268A47|nr:hypothetical protein [uncultured Olegusella sp.]